MIIGLLVMSSRVDASICSSGVRNRPLSPEARPADSWVRGMALALVYPFLPSFIDDVEIRESGDVLSVRIDFCELSLEVTIRLRVEVVDCSLGRDATDVCELDSDAS